MALKFPCRSSKRGEAWEDLPEKKLRIRKYFILEKRLKEGEEAFGVTHSEWRTYEAFRTYKYAENQMVVLRNHYYWKRFEFRITHDFNEE